MKRLLILLGTVCLSLPLHAQLNRSYLSARTGNDANPCSFAAPCRTFDRAISLSNAGAEIIVLEGGGFAPFTIDRSIMIQAPPSVFVGVIAGSGGPAIQLNVTSGDVVIRGLTLTGVGSNHGIIGPARNLHLEDMIVDGFNYVGVSLQSNAETFVTRSMFRNSGIGLSYNDPDGGAARLTVAGSWFTDNQDGILTAYDVRTFISDSLISGNSSRGIYSYQNTAVVENCRIVQNNIGIRASSQAVVYVSGSSIAFNNEGFDSGSISRGNNTVIGNTTGETFGGTFAPK